MWVTDRRKRKEDCKKRLRDVKPGSPYMGPIIAAGIYNSMFALPNTPQVAEVIDKRPHKYR